MSASEFQNLLKKLRLEINNISLTDKSSIEMLNGLKSEIERVLEQDASKLDSGKSSLLNKMEKSVEHFEASHPELTAKIQNVINFLNNLGL